MGLKTYLGTGGAVKAQDNLLGADLQDLPGAVLE